MPCILAFLLLRKSSPSSWAILSTSSATYPLTHVSVTSIQACADIWWVFIHYFYLYERTSPHLPITPKEAPLSSRDQVICFLATPGLRVIYFSGSLCLSSLLKYPTWSFPFPSLLDELEGSSGDIASSCLLFVHSSMGTCRMNTGTNIG